MELISISQGPGYIRCYHFSAHRVRQGISKQGRFGNWENGLNMTSGMNQTEENTMTAFGSVMFDTGMINLNNTTMDEYLEHVLGPRYIDSLLTIKTYNNSIKSTYEIYCF